MVFVVATIAVRWKRSLFYAAHNKYAASDDATINATMPCRFRYTIHRLPALS